MVLFQMTDIWVNDSHSNEKTLNNVVFKPIFNSVPFSGFVTSSHLISSHLISTHLYLPSGTVYYALPLISVILAFTPVYLRLPPRLAW